jgi:hypothetical protein
MATADHGRPLEAPAPDSPRGLLDRALRSTVSDPALALDRLAAVDGLRRLLAGLEGQAVLGARAAGCSWAQMGAAVDVTSWQAYCRWREQVRRFEATGLIRPDQLPPPAPPVDPDAGANLRDARAWCRWCGHRVVNVGGGWAHNSTHGPAGELIDVECPGDEPWPANCT